MKAKLLMLCLLFCMLIGITDYRIIGFAVVFFVATTAIQWDKISFPKWILIPWAIIAISAFAHMVLGHNRMDIIGLYLVLLAPLLYWAGQSLRMQLKFTLLLLAVLASLTTIAHRIIDPATIYPSYLAVTHITAFAIMLGLVFSPKKLMLPMLAICLPALAMSGSEEGILALVVLGLVALFGRRWNIRYLIPVGAAIITVGVLVPTGLMAKAYPRLSEDRLQITDLDTMTHLRWSGYSDMLKYTNWKTGVGYYWQEVGSGEAWPGIKWQTTHNVPLRITSQYGIIAGLAWFAMMVYGLWRYRATKYAYLFLLFLVFGMVDHMLWTYLLLWPWVLIGASEDKPAYVYTGGRI